MKRYPFKVVPALHIRSVGPRRSKGIMAHHSGESRQPLHCTSRAANPSRCSFVSRQTSRGPSLSQVFRFITAPNLGKVALVKPGPRCLQLRSALPQRCIGSLRIAANRNVAPASVSLSRCHVRRYRSSSVPNHRFVRTRVSEAVSFQGCARAAHPGRWASKE